jgi:hypothetical protein
LHQSILPSGSSLATKTSAAPALINVVPFLQSSEPASEPAITASPLSRAATAVAT